MPQGWRRAFVSAIRTNPFPPKHARRRLHQSRLPGLAGTTGRGGGVGAGERSGEDLGPLVDIPP